MFEYIEGKITGINPAYAIIDIAGIGYLVHITLNTYSQVQPKESAKLFLHHIVREDAEMLFGFSTIFERDIFRLLISVNGVGANTARMMLSSLSPAEVQNAILTGEVNQLKSVKGIGLKTAQRIIVDLKDKIGKERPSGELFLFRDNTVQEEALSALGMLGFPKSATEKVLRALLQVNPAISVEDLVKSALKQL